VLPLSAQTPNALRELAARYAAHLAAPSSTAPSSAPNPVNPVNPANPVILSPSDFAAICYTAGAGRSHFNHRLAIVAADAAAAQADLAAYADNRQAPGIHTGQAPAGVQPDVTFLYTGHGANYTGMGRQLYLGQPVFRAALDECAALTRHLLEQPLLSVLYPDLVAGSPANSLERMTYAQVALFSLQYALTQLWRSWGMQPALVMGHSAGEYAAAAAAGVFSLADSLKLVLARGQLMEAPSMDGVMAAVFADAERVEPLLAPYAGEVAIAGYNGPNNVVISGATAAVQQVLQSLAAAHIKSRRLPIAQAAHSPLLDPLLDAFEGQVSALTGQAPYLGLVSSVTGQLASAGELTSAAYWRAHLRQPVRFQQAMMTLHGLGQRIFVEIGPRPMLTALGRRCLPDDGGLWVASLREEGQDGQQMAESLALLYTHGVQVNWEGVAGGSRQRVELPTYPFQRKRYWTSITPPAPIPANPANPVILSPSETAASIAETAAALSTAGELQSVQAPIDLAVWTYAAKWEALRRLSSGYITAALQELGALRLLEASALSPVELAAQLHVLPTYTGLLGRWLRRLAAEGVLAAVGECFSAPHVLPPPDLGALRAAAQEQLADARMLFDYVERCGPRLAAVLTGALSGLETLFPGGSPALAEAIYQEWAGSRYYANLMRGVLGAYVAAHGLRPLRILEVGAGTGATTAGLLPSLPAARTHYDFTDVSDLFLSRAAAKFAAYPFLRFGRLDLEQPPSEQGYAAGSYHVIVATNVLHATANLRATLDHLRGLLAPGGLLLINEVTDHLAWYDITTGLIEGWQRFDDDLRDDQPLLDAPTWERALAEHGYTAVAAWPAAGSAPAVLGQHVIAALNPAGAAEQQAAETSAQSRNGADPASAPLPQTPVSPVNPANPVNPVILFSASATESATESPAVLRLQLQAAVPDERDDLLFALVGTHIRQVLRLDAGVALERGNRLLDLGLDSLMALELRRLLAAGLGLEEDALSATLVFDYPTVGAIVAHLADQIATLEPPAAGVAASAPASPALNTAGPARTLQLADVAAMSDAEVEALLLARLREHE
jgi:malonyl CoA-acyl carrier protein transacylase